MNFEHELAFRGRRRAQGPQVFQKLLPAQLARVQVEEEIVRRGQLGGLVHRHATKQLAQRRHHAAALRQRQQVRRARAQIAVHAARQCFVTQRFGCLQVDDRLEENSHPLLADEFFEVLRAAGDTERRFRLDRLRIVRLRLVGFLAVGGGDEAKFLMGYVKDIVVGERRFGDAIAVDERAVGAAQIADAELVGALKDLGVLFGDLVRGDDELRGHGAADAERQRAKQDATHGSDMPRVVLEVGHSSGAARVRNFDLACATGSRRNKSTGSTKSIGQVCLHRRSLGNSFEIAEIPAIQGPMAQPKPAVVSLGDLMPGQSGDFFALLAEKSRNARRDGKPFFTCRFRDARRTATLMVWADGPWFELCERDWKEGQFYKLRAIYDEHKTYGPQIEPSQIRPIKETDKDDGFDPLDFVECSRLDRAAMFVELRALAEGHIADAGLRRLTLTLLERHAAPLQQLPATPRHFYPFCGGLLEHTLSVTRNCLWLAEKYAAQYADLRPALNKDLVVAGAILHDIGRVLE